MNYSLIKWAELEQSERLEVLKRPVNEINPGLKPKVEQILFDVKSNKDKAVREYNLKFDKAVIDCLRVSDGEIREAYAKVEDRFIVAIRESVKNIESFHKAQQPIDITVQVAKGVECRKVYLPIEKVGLYVPAGTAPLPSTVMMLGVPALIAGCHKVVLCSPPDENGKIDPAVLVAADIVGLNEIYKVGGAQAVAAMAFGTESIPKVDKIFGPGNAWVTEAKQQVSVDKDGAAIDMPAGPSEVLVIGDDGSNPAFIASDLLSQAEHGKDSQVVLLTTNERLFQDVVKNLESQLMSLSRKNIALSALKNSVFILASSEREMVEISNAYAPEHLIIQTKEPELTLNHVRNAGSVFLGPYSPESVGDYSSGTNHVLPTYGYAKTYSGLSIDSFVKSMSIQKLNKEGLLNIAQTVETLADVEGLDGHKNAVSLRVAKIRASLRDADKIT